MADFPFDVVGFDLDGTLVDSHQDLACATNHALSLEGRDPVEPQVIRGLVGGGAKKLLARALEESGGPVGDERFEALHDALLVHYEANLSVHTRLFPGGEAMLDDLAARGVRLAVVTNKLERFARRLLADLALTERFATIIGGDTLGKGRAKPAPDLLNLMLERCGGGRAAYVGDTSYDTRAADAAGWPCVTVTFGFHDRPPHDLGSAAVIDHFDDLVPTLARL